MTHIEQLEEALKQCCGLESTKMALLASIAGSCADIADMLAKNGERDKNED